MTPVPTPAPYDVTPGGPDGVEIAPRGRPTLELLGACCRHAAERVLLALELPGPDRAECELLVGDHSALRTAEGLLDDLGASPALSRARLARLLAPRVLRTVQVAEWRLHRLRGKAAGN